MDRIIEWIKEISNTGWYQVIEFIFFIGGIIGVLRVAFKKSKGIKARGYFLILTILLVGLVLPTIRLIIWDWTGTVDTILNILAMLCLLNFLGLLFVMKQMDVFTSKIQKEEQTIHIRGSHGFFDGALKVYLEWEDWGSYPPKHLLTGKIWAPGKREIIFKNRSVGFSISYDSKYLIRITGAQTNEATFEVTRQ